LATEQCLCTLMFLLILFFMRLYAFNLAWLFALMLF
jgi:hypothetical protein